MTHVFSVISAEISADPSLWSAAVYRTDYREGGFPDVVREFYDIPLDGTGHLLNDNIFGNLPTNLPESFLSNLASVSVELPTTTSNDCYVAVFYKDHTGPFYFSTPIHCMNEDEVSVTMPAKFDTFVSFKALNPGDTINESVVVTDVSAPLYQGPSTRWALAAEDAGELGVLNNSPSIGFVRKFIGDAAIMFGVGNLQGPAVFSVLHNDSEYYQHACGVTYLVPSSGGGTGTEVDLTEVLSKLDALALQIDSVDTNVIATSQTVGAKVDAAKVASDNQFTGVHADISVTRDSMASYHDTQTAQMTSVNNNVTSQASMLGSSMNSQFSGVQGSISAIHPHLNDAQTAIIAEITALDVGGEGIPQNVIDMIMDLHAEAMGSWSWDKRTGILTMFDTHGLEAAKFSVTDTADLAARERRADLEAN